MVTETLSNGVMLSKREGSRKAGDRARVETSRGWSHHHADSGSFYEGLSRKPQFAAPVFGQVLPAGIQLLDQRGFLFATPALDLLFTGYCRTHLLEAFVVNQAMALILFREAFNRVELVLMNALVEISSDSDIKRTGAACEDIDPILLIESVTPRGKACP